MIGFIAPHHILGCAAALAVTVLGLTAWSAVEPSLMTLELSAAAVLAVAVLGLGWLFDREFRRRTAAEAEARRAADRFHHDKIILEAVLKALPDGVVLADQAGRVVQWNDLLLQVLELDRRAIVGAADPNAALDAALAALGQDTPTLREMARPSISTAVHEAALPSGKWIECRRSYAPSLGCIAVYRDIAERKQRETEIIDNQTRLQTQTTALARLAQDLDQARRMAETARIEAEAASRTKSSFVTGMNHELRTPLNAILGFAQVIREQHFGRDAIDRYREYADHIFTSGEHLLLLINDLLDMAKIEAGKMDLIAQPVDVRQLLSATLLMVKETAARGVISLQLEAPDAPIMLRGDPRRLKQCFLNLVSNAVKFTPTGGKVVVTVSPGSDCVTVAVSDTGIGVKAGDIARIFEPFTQIDSPQARRHIGTGLGLPLARSLAEMHGGALSFRSIEGTGTTVTVSLPCRKLVA